MRWSFNFLLYFFINGNFLKIKGERLKRLRRFNNIKYLLFNIYWLLVIGYWLRLRLGSQTKPSGLLIINDF